MIKSDQPNCFPGNVLAAVSSRTDGTMLNRTEQSRHGDNVVACRKAFCAAVGLRYEQCVYQLIQYDDYQLYTVVKEVTSADVSGFRADVAADGLFTGAKDVGLFLPVADCVATVMYDPVQQYLGLLHLGRHSTYADLSTCAIKYFTERGSRAEDIILWMSPSAGKDSYCLEWFDYEADPRWQDFYVKKHNRYYLDLAGYNKRHFVEHGVRPENIYVSSVDTITDGNYFSHQSGDTNGRIAVVAMMK